MAKPQCLVFILRHKGLKSLKFGSVHRPKSWLCSFSTGLAQNNLAASWPSTFLLYQPGLDPGSISAKLDRSVPQTNQSVRQRVTVQNLHHESNPDWSHSFPPGFVPSFPPHPPPHATCHRFLYIFLMCVPAFGFEPLCEMLPQHLNLSWTATRADVGLLTTLNLCDTKPVLPARWLRTANHYMPFHYTFHYEMSNHPIPLFQPDCSFSSVDARFISFRLYTPKGQRLRQHRRVRISVLGFKHFYYTGLVVRQLFRYIPQFPVIVYPALSVSGHCSLSQLSLGEGGVSVWTVDKWY